MTPNLRAEGYTEQTGDIIITCVGGQPLLPGANIPLVNITVFYNTNAVTSRLLGTAGASGQTPSEALLLVDEPTTGDAANIGTGPGQSSYGATLPLLPCLTPFTGCAQKVGPTNAGFATAVVPGTDSPAPNVYQGCDRRQLRDVLRRPRSAPVHDWFARLPHHQRTRRRYLWRSPSRAKLRFRP